MRRRMQTCPSAETSKAKVKGIQYRRGITRVGMTEGKKLGETGLEGQRLYP